MSANLGNLNFISLSPDTPLWTMQFESDTGETCSITIARNLTAKIEGKIQPMYAARMLSQTMQLATLDKLSMDALDVVEDYKKAVIEKAKTMSNEDLIKELESDLFYYYLTGEDEGDE